MLRRTIASLLPLLLAGLAPAAAEWPPERRAGILDATAEVRLDPDLSHLSAGERAAVDELLAVGAIFQRLHEDALHPEAARVRAELAARGERDLLDLYRLFQGPIATTLDNAREPFVDVAPATPGKAMYPPDLDREEVDRFLAAHPEAAPSIVDPRSVVRRATAESLAADRATLARHPVFAALHPALDGELARLAAAPDPAVLYAVPQAVAWADALVEAQRALFRAAAAVEGDDPELARYLRNRGRDLLSNDYESGDAAWVTGRFRNLNAQIGSYETYDDALLGVKAFPSLSVLARDAAASEAIAAALAGLQAIEDALPYDARKRVREAIPVGVYEVVADFGQARGTNTASILPNEPLFASRYGRVVLVRANIIRHPVIQEARLRRWRAAVVPELGDDLTAEGDVQRTFWHEIGHYLGVDRTPDGRDLNAALGPWGQTLEEMKADLVSLFAVPRLVASGALPESLLPAVEADGILRTLQNARPRPDQPYQTMQLAQFNFFLSTGLLQPTAGGRLALDRRRYEGTVRELLAQVLELQAAGDPAAAAAFFERWTGWSDDLHGTLAERLGDAQGRRFRLVRYGVLDPVAP